MDPPEGCAACEHRSRECWASAREELRQAQNGYGEKSPEAWAAAKVYEVLEDLEIASRPDSQNLRSKTR